MTYTPANSVTVTDAGTYEIGYSSILSAANASDVTLSVRQNGTNLPSTPLTKNMTTGETSLFSGDTVVSLNAGDVLDMAVTANTAGNVALVNGVNAMMTVKRLD